MAGASEVSCNAVHANLEVDKADFPSHHTLGCVGLALLSTSSSHSRNPSMQLAHFAPLISSDQSPAVPPPRCKQVLVLDIVQVKDRKYGRTLLALFAPPDPSDEEDKDSGVWQNYS